MAAGSLTRIRSTAGASVKSIAGGPGASGHHGRSGWRTRRSRPLSEQRTT